MARTCAIPPAILLATMTACGSPHAHPDARAPADAAGDGPCGGDVFFTGELVDFDSSNAQFCGIFGATLAVRGDATRTNKTNPNGRFQLCLAPAATTIVDVTPPAGMSECTVPASTYAAPGILVASRDVIASGAIVSAREFTVARAPAFGYDATKAQVLVHVDGTLQAVSITAAHGVAQAQGAAGWAPGSTGVNVLFPNVDPSAGSTTIGTAGAALGTGDVPLAPGAFTFVTVSS